MRVAVQAPRLPGEVALEANRSASRSAAQRGRVELGHLHRFARCDIRALARAAGLHVVDEQLQPDVVRRFDVRLFPTLVVVADHLERRRLERPSGCREIEALLAPWLR